MRSAFIVFDRMTSLDFIGFYDPVTRLKSMNIIDDFEWRICLTTRYVVDDRGLRIEADAVSEPLGSYDILFVPGGFGTRNLQQDRNFIDWLKAARSVPLKISVCTGALLLGAAGFLQGRRATHIRPHTRNSSPTVAWWCAKEWSTRGTLLLRVAFRLLSTWACTWSSD